MAVLRCSYELNVPSLLLRLRLRRALCVHLSFYPYKNPRISTSWSAPRVRAEFDYHTDDPTAEASSIEGGIQLRLDGLFRGTDRIPYLRADPALGPMIWEPFFWRGEYEWVKGEFIWFTFWADCEPGHLAEMRRRLIGPWFAHSAAKQAKSVLPQLATLNESWLDGAARELLPLFNAEWNAGAPLNSSEFRDKLSLEGLEFRDDGSACVWYDQDGMFTDHSVVVDVNRRCEVQSAGLEG